MAGIFAMGHCGHFGNEVLARLSAGCYGRGSRDARLGFGLHFPAE